MSDNVVFKVGGVEGPVLVRYELHRNGLALLHLFDFFIANREGHLAVADGTGIRNRVILCGRECHRQFDGIARHGEAVVAGGILLYFHGTDRTVGLLIAHTLDRVVLVRIRQNRNHIARKCRIGEETGNRGFKRAALCLGLRDAQALFKCDVHIDVGVRHGEVIVVHRNGGAGIRADYFQTLYSITGFYIAPNRNLNTGRCRRNIILAVGRGKSTACGKSNGITRTCSGRSGTGGGCCTGDNNSGRHRTRPCSGHIDRLADIDLIHVIPAVQSVDEGAHRLIADSVAIADRRHGLAGLYLMRDYGVARPTCGRSRNQQDLARPDVVGVRQTVDRKDDRRIVVIVAVQLAADAGQRIARLHGIGREVIRNITACGSCADITGRGGHGRTANRRRCYHGSRG